MEKINIKKNVFIYNVDKSGGLVKPIDVSKTWMNGYHEKRSGVDGEGGLRFPQYGALNAIRAHWTISNEAATIVMPTGTGKTETMFATILSERLKTTLIIVPSDLLRKQIYENVQHFGIFPKLGMVDSSALMPNTTILASIPSNIEELKELVENSNIIVSTMSLLAKFQNSYKRYLSTICETLIFDEAHHMAARTWSNFREYFRNSRILQFTATPYRDDGKKIVGKLIYNYPLALAQEQGYFKGIDYYPVEEFDELKGDKAIAKKAVEILKKDKDKGNKHIILARASNRERAKSLFENIYNKYYSKFNPVLVISGQSKAVNTSNIKKLREYKSQIVVCVDMFGEGVDIPSLKIAAIHDKYKSLPITLQFIGRFARTKENLGNAKLITNIANDDLKSQVAELFQQDSDWNKLLNIVSAEKITEQINIHALLESLDNREVSDIDIYQLQMKISTRMFNYSKSDWLNENWKSVLNPDNAMCYYSKSERLMVLVEKVESNVAWSTQKDINELDWNLFVIYYDTENNIIHINETDQGKGNRLIEAMFPHSTRIQGDVIFRTLDGVNRLMIGTLGLRNELPGKVSYRMFAGTDVAEGVSNAIRGTSTKSNLFGNGFDGNGKVSIGCSYRGKVWSRWIESLSYWKDWCNSISKKVRDNDINAEDILEGSLKGITVSSFPKGILYKAELANDAELENSPRKGFIKGKNDKIVPLSDCELNINSEKSNNNNLVLILEIQGEEIEFQYTLTEDYFKIEQLSDTEIFYVSGRTKIPVQEYFMNEPPRVWIMGEGKIYSLESNIQVDLKGPTNGKFGEKQILPIDWGQLNVNIRKESQGRGKDRTSIQYAMINSVLHQDDYQIIFDDDDSGEVADIIAIRETTEMIEFDFFHCKYSSKQTPGARTEDLYEVCGQTEKSLRWANDYVALVERLMYRESKYKAKFGTNSRIEKGSLNDLNTIKNKLKVGKKARINMNIVQPGVKMEKISDEMNIILLACESFLRETYGSNVKLYCS
ncbi:DEAD/DEAH box helicase [Ornithinibacillus contaminans]|uniref:DEAD/DEAH box helicase n=1 Tax=Ornithinibacillus contaminans TaxID=694055 RepID=UPI00064E13E2|nr:DEAD/DEAH box helicase family protein [Ornithinibacillus contaminans]